MAGVRLKGLVLACHPGPCLVVTAIAILLGVAVGRNTGTLALIGAAVLTGQLSIGWCNDALDATRDTGRTDKPVAKGTIRAHTIGVAAVVAGIACVPLSLAVGWLPGGLHLIAVGSALAYDFWLKSTVLSVVPYLVSFGLLPLVTHVPAPWWLPLAGALLGAGAHFANVLPDLASDRAAGVIGLPHRLGATGTRWAAGLLLFAAAVVLVVGPSGHAPLRLALAGAALVVLVAGLVAGGRWAFRAVLVVALLDVAQLVIAGASLR